MKSQVDIKVGKTADRPHPTTAAFKEKHAVQSGVYSCNYKDNYYGDQVCIKAKK